MFDTVLWLCYDTYDTMFDTLFAPMLWYYVWYYVIIMLWHDEQQRSYIRTFDLSMSESADTFALLSFR